VDVLTDDRLSQVIIYNEKMKTIVNIYIGESALVETSSERR